MTNRLEINGTTVATDGNLVIGISFSINDLSDIGAIKAAKTLPIQVVGTSGTNRLFDFIFNPSSVGDNFNPNKKLPAVYYKNEIPFFIGTIQLLEVGVKFVGSAQYPTYSLFMTGKVSDFFVNIATAKLTDIDWSDLDHAFTCDSHKFPLQWNETSPSSYVGRLCYPFIDYGASGIPQTSNWTFEALKPAIFLREYWKRIFEYAGKRFTSDFIDSDYYKKIIVPCNTEGYLKNSEEPLTDYQVIATRSGTLTGTPVNATFVGGNLWNIANIYDAWLEPISIPTESIDPANAYNTTTFIWSCQNAGKYIFSGTLNFSLNFFVSDSSTAVTSSDLKFELSFYKREGAGPWALAYADFPSLAFSQTSAAGINKTYSQSYSLQIETPEIVCTSISEVRFVLRQSSPSGINIASVSTGTVTTRIDTLTDTNLTVNATSFELQYGQNVDMQATIPDNISMLEFISDVMRYENMLIELDPDDPDNYFIEPRNSFFDQGVNEWSEKFDPNKGMTIKPMSRLEFKQYNLKFTPDQDKYSEDYTQRTGKGYGDYTYDVDNDFINQEKTIQVMFAPSIIVGSYDTPIVAMRFYKDGNTPSEVTPIATRIRLAYWKQTVLCPAYTFNFNGTAYTSNSYPFAGSVDDPYNPTLDLNFGMPDLIYLKFSGNYTDNNRGNVQYLQMLNEISDRDSKEVIAFFKLNESDLYNFTFRKLVYFNGEYYYCNSIDEFNPNGSESTMVSLFRLNPSTEFDPTNIALSGSGILIGLGGSSNYTYNGGFTLGSGNFNNGGIVIGDSNIIGSGSQLNLDEFSF